MDELASNLWQRLDVASDVQARHALATITAAVAIESAAKEEPDQCIGQAADFVGDNGFSAFLKHPKVHQGLHKLAKDTRAAAERHDLKELFSITQYMLLRPTRGPASLTKQQEQDLLETAASICTYWAYGVPAFE